MRRITKSPSYLIRNPYSYCYRRNVPLTLQPLVGKKELRYSLKTGYIGIAKQKAQFLSTQIQILFNSLRKGGLILEKPTNKQLLDIVDQYIKDSLEKMECTFLTEGDEKVVPFGNQQEFFDYARNLDSIRDDLIANINLGDYSMLEDRISDVLKQHGIEDMERESVEFKKLCADLHKAEIKLIPIQNKHMLCDDSYQKDLPKLFPKLYPTPNKALPPSPQPQPQPQQISEKLEKAIQEFWNEHSDDWKPRSKTDYKGYLKHIQDVLGAKTQLHTLDYTKIKDFRDGLRSGKLSKNSKPLSVGRINNYIGFLKQIYQLAMRRDKYLDRVNPAEGLRLKDKRRPDEKQDTFSTEDLEMIFIKSAEYGQDKHKHAHSFWLPLLGLYTGARLEELCQLFITDVVERDNVWCLDINETDAPNMKSVKNSERRIVPLHSFLVNNLNFIDYVKSIPKKDLRVFPKLTRVSHRWGHGYSQRFGEFKKKCGVVAPPRMKTFHSFRHTFIDFLKQNDGEWEHVKEYVGHSSRGDITWGTYGKQFKPQVLVDKIVSKLKYPIDLSHLKTSKWVR